MIYAIELYFDKKTEEKIMNLPHEIAEKGISKRYLEWQTRPHITLGLFNDINIEKCDKLLKELARQVKSFPAHLSSIGVFNNSKCAFLSPALLKIQKFNINHVYIACIENNIRSIKVIEKDGGIFINTVIGEDGILNKLYHIN